MSSDPSTREGQAEAENKDDAPQTREQYSVIPESPAASDQGGAVAQEYLPEAAMRQSFGAGRTPEGGPAPESAENAATPAQSSGSAADSGPALAEPPATEAAEAAAAIAAPAVTVIAAAPAMAAAVIASASATDAPAEAADPAGADPAGAGDAVQTAQAAPQPGEQVAPAASLAQERQTAEAEENLSFAEMLAAHEKEEAPQSRLTPGQRVTVRVVAITADTIFVSTGSKVDGIVDREEMEVDGELRCEVGDMVDLYVVTVSPHEIKLSKILRGAGNISVLEEARDAGLPVEGKVTAQVKGGYSVDIMKRRAFCPASQIDLRPPADAEEPVGNVYAFLITRLEKGGRNIVVSRRSLLEREQAENREALLAEIHEGDIREGRITRLAPFGAFVELAPGVEGLTHLSELSWTRVGQADEAVSVGDLVRVKIVGIHKDDKGVRISLSIKQVQEDPWKSVSERLAAGDVVTGRVVRNAPFGAFVEILPGVEGLVHLSELSYDRRIMKADEVVAPGDMVSVKIKEIEQDKRRISLSLRDAAGNPWDSLAESMTQDAEIMGTVEKRAPFGLFITLAPGITGLMPSSVIQASPSRKSLERLGPGDAVEVRLAQIDRAARRISLSPAGEESASEAAVEKDWKRHAPKPAPAPSMGSLGLALQEAMKKKK
ncbi:30S ribosomal protein S1 [Desulfovibrio sp. OttesenSCG-928-A18]|nr:30S ribosomal protein S1 [Desulfovibrio sp. OttesenSCG-928-A18]